MDEAFRLPDGRVLAGHGGEEAEMPVETLSWRREAHPQRQCWQPTSPPVRARHCLTPRFYLLWRQHRTGLRFPLAGLAGGRPAPQLTLCGVTLAAFISEAEEKYGQGPIEKQSHRLQMSAKFVF